MGEPVPSNLETQVKLLKRLAIAALAASALSTSLHAAEVTIGIRSEPSSVDPYFHNLGPNNAMLGHIFGRLVEWSDATTIFKAPRPPVHHPAAPPAWQQALPGGPQSVLQTAHRFWSGCWCATQRCADHNSLYHVGAGGEPGDGGGQFPAAPDWTGQIGSAGARFSGCRWRHCPGATRSGCAEWRPPGLVELLRDYVPGFCREMADL